MKTLLSSIYILLFSASLVSSNVIAATYEVDSDEENVMVLNYDGFFDRIDDLDEPEYRDIKLAFYLKNTSGEPCQVKSIQLRTQLNAMDVYFLDSGELLLPFEPKYDEDKAAIVINKATNETCGIDMRLESSILLTDKISTEKSIELINALDAGFSDLGGMMSFMLPDVTGITFIIEPDKLLYLSDSRIGKCSKNSCTITKKELMTYNKVLSFNHAPKKAFALIE